MSQANIPNISPNITITREDAINLILSSVAMEELGLSHILNAEGEKLQYVLGTLPGLTGPPATISDILAVNDSVRRTLDSTTRNQMFLQSKMESALSATVMVGPTGATGNTGATGATGEVVHAFGALFETELSSISLSGTPTTVELDLPSNASQNISFATANAITIVEAGTYRVDIWVSGLAIATASIGAQLAINNSAQIDMVQNLDLSASEVGTIVLTNYYTLAAGDELTIQMIAGTAVEFFFPTFGIGATLSVQRLL